MSEQPVMYPFLRYKDAPAAIDFLISAFGFETLMSVPGDNGTIAHAQLHLGPAIVMVGTGEDESARTVPDDMRAVTQGVYVAIDDVDAHCERANAAGARILRGPEDMEYGSREYSAVDPGGHVWSFGSYRPVVPDVPKPA